MVAMGDKNSSSLDPVSETPWSLPAHHGCFDVLANTYPVLCYSSVNP